VFLSPHEIEKLTLVQVGVLAQRRLARGLKLNHPEAIGLIATVMLELIRDGKHSVRELMEVGRTMLGTNQVMPGVAEMIPDVQVEGTFPDGTKLVSVHEPIYLENGDLNLALFGSFLPVPNVSAFGWSSRANRRRRCPWGRGIFCFDRGAKGKRSGLGYVERIARTCGGVASVWVVCPSSRSFGPRFLLGW